MTQKERLDKWLMLYTDAKSKRAAIDMRIGRRLELYKGIAQPLGPDGLPTKKKAACSRNMCFELIETQINNGIPQPKVTPRDSNNKNLANELETYLQLEMDRLHSEELNDVAERETLIQGTCFYLVGWDETQSTPTTSGELFVKEYPLARVYPQPGVTDFHKLEYIFTEDLVSVKEIKDLYGKDVPDCGEFIGLNVLITVYYYSKEGYVCRFGWIRDTEIVVFDQEDYELRQIKVCKECGEKLNDNTECPLCHSTKYEWVSLEDETLTEDLVRGDLDNPEQAPQVLAPAGSTIPYYKIKKLPFVRRVNISNVDSLYGISDIDLLEENQISMNKIMTKMRENVLKAGSFVTKPAGVNIPNTDETLKPVTLKDPNQVKAFGVFNVQANMQQDNILQETLYQMGRDCLGITDSYQGKRDTTAESGKAKQVSAAQAAGRMESKRRMKDAAYADLYQMMSMFLLAYCDEPRTFTRVKPNGELVEGHFNRYNYIDGEPGDLYYNDRFMFSVDDASTLATNRTALWQETTNNFVAGTFGNPADPTTLIMYWRMMDGLNYPLAKQVLATLEAQTKQLPQGLQDAIMQNPEILQAVQAVVQNPDLITVAQEGGMTNANTQ